jgi:hypothetical protein
LINISGREYQAEVALLSRNIVIQGVNSMIDFPSNQRCTGSGHGTSTFPCKAAEGFGGHIMVAGNGIGRCTAVELFEMGQTNIIGRYPFHLHMIGNNGAKSFFVDGSIHRSFWRCVTIHGTNQAYVARNTAYHVSGHCFYLEDGVEENNTFEHNFAGYIHMMGPITNPGRYYSQELDDVWSQSSVLVPTDVTAAGFYIPNPNNNYIGNAASGGWAGFAFPDLPSATGLSRGVRITPSSRPSGIFDGNSAHSSGHWWSHAAAIYMGGQFTQDNDNLNSQKYNPGRQSGKSFHETCSGPLESWGRCAIHNRRWLRFTNTKVFLASRGLMHWGERAELIRLEAHDTGIAANVFGQVWLDQLFVTCRSANSQPKYNNCPSSGNEFWNCHIRDLAFFNGFSGFQWYDVGQSHIVTNAIFRSCTNLWPERNGNCDFCHPWSFLTHSDWFVPEVMQATRNIKYENCNMDNLWRYDTRTANTVAGRLTNWIDEDGTASGRTGGPHIIGSTWANDWWNLGNDICSRSPGRTDMWICRAKVGTRPLTTVGSVFLETNPNMHSKVGYEICGNGDGKPCPIIGFVQHLTRDTLRPSGMQLTWNTKITGPIDARLGGGWYVRYYDGAPKNLRIRSIQLQNPSTTLILAVPYPPGSSFTIVGRAASWCSPNNGVTCTYNYIRVWSIQELIQRQAGESYYWDDQNNVLYVQVVQQMDWDLGRNGQFDRSRRNPTEFTRNEITVSKPTNDFVIDIQSSCATGSNPRFCSLTDDFDRNKATSRVNSAINLLIGS